MKKYDKAVAKRDRLYKKFDAIEDKYYELKSKLRNAEYECIKEAGFRNHKTLIELPIINFSGCED
jgi:hypothetical protein